MGQPSRPRGSTTWPWATRRRTADALRARGGAAGRGLALAGPARLWLGGVVSARREGAPVRLLLLRVRACAASAASLLCLCVDGFAASVSAAWPVSRIPQRTGRRGRPRLVWPHGFLRAPVVKGHQGQRRSEIVRQVVVGMEAAVAAALARTRGGTTITTASIERCTALLRAPLAPRVRRRTPAHGTALLTSGMWLVGAAYNWCWPQQSLRPRASGIGRR